MPKTLTVYRCLLMSPGDVQPERDAIVRAVESWNAQFGGPLDVRVEIVRWETHAHPEMGAAPQAIINKQIVDDCDFGIAVFWSRIGTATQEHESGSAEEIARLLAKQATVMLYFCSRPIPQSHLKDDQFDKLQALKQKYEGSSLYWSYETPDDLASKVTLHLGSTVLARLSKDRTGHQPAPLEPAATRAMNIRVRVTAVKLMPFTGGTGPVPKYLQVKVENHDDRDLYFSGVSFAVEDDKAFMVTHDACTRQAIVPTKIAPGDALLHHFEPKAWPDLSQVKNAFASDKLNRRYYADPIEFEQALQQHLAPGA